jgi:hypothetical protein
MPKSRHRNEPAPPLYIRWTPDVCPYALEMRLDLITRLTGELAQAEALGVEIGGVFIGVFPTPDSPTLRLDDVVFVPRDVIGGNVAGGAEFILDSAQLQQMVQMTAEALFSERPAVGFFRSHLRNSPPAPSPADSAMLTQLFPQGLYAFLLIFPGAGSTAQRQGAFYLAIAGRLPETPSSPVFPFNENAFQALPELPVEATEDVRNFNFGRNPPRRPVPWPAIASLAVLLFLAATWIFGSRIAQLFRPAAYQIALSAMSSGSTLKITWDHSAPIVSSAFGATMVIMDGRTQRELKLDSDELKLGQVAYERLTRRVYIVMSIEAPGKKLTPQTFDWTGD